MNYKYFVYFNGHLHTRTLTLGKAVKLALKLWPSYVLNTDGKVIWNGEGA